jgi:hypothetical protein
MASIYTDSYITIAASASRNGNEGLNRTLSDADRQSKFEMQSGDLLTISMYILGKITATLREEHCLFCDVHGFSKKEYSPPEWCTSETGSFTGSVEPRRPVNAARPGNATSSTHTLQNH